MTLSLGGGGTPKVAIRVYAANGLVILRLVIYNRVCIFVTFPRTGYNFSNARMHTAAILNYS